MDDLRKWCIFSFKSLKPLSVLLVCIQAISRSSLPFPQSPQFGYKRAPQAQFYTVLSWTQFRHNLVDKLPSIVQYNTSPKSKKMYQASVTQYPLYSQFLMIVVWWILLMTIINSNQINVLTLQDWMSGQFDILKLILRKLGSTTPALGTICFTCFNRPSFTHISIIILGFLNHKVLPNMSCQVGNFDQYAVHLIISI